LLVFITEPTITIPISEGITRDSGYNRHISKESAYDPKRTLEAIRKNGSLGKMNFLN
jgi:hypothetical protein